MREETVMGMEIIVPDARRGLPQNPTIHSRYTGQQFDSATGLYSLRARYYNPALGRFLSGDTYPYNTNNPVELNRYVYAANDPINGFDPTGQFLEPAVIQSRVARAVVAISGVGIAAASYFARTSLIVASYLPQLLSLSADEILSLISIGQSGLQLLSNSSLASGWGGSGGGGGDDGGDDGWGDLDFPEPGDPNGEGRHIRRDTSQECTWNLRV